METTTITNRTLEITGMTGDECIQKVTGALKGIPGVSIQSVKVGSAAITADTASCSSACAVIEAAGYKARERGGQNNQNNNKQNNQNTNNNNNNKGGALNAGGTSGASSTQASPTNAPSIPLEPKQDLKPIIAGSSQPVPAGTTN